MGERGDERGVRPRGARLPLADRAFRGVSRSSGALVLVLMLLVGGFLTYRAWQALRLAGWAFFSTAAWQPDAHYFGIAGILLGTVLIGLVAICFAVPLALGTALYIAEYAPPRLQRLLVSLVDLAAAVPSVVYGLWGFAFLQEHVLGLSKWLATYLSWIPLFRVPGGDPHDPLVPLSLYKSSTFICGIVVALMVTPIACSVMREAFSQAPPGEREGALALGATRWGMIRAVVLPFGRGGIIGGTMLGLGRALGETIAIFMIIGMLYSVQPHILANGGSSVAALIAQLYGSASAFGTSALMAAGLALFALTLVVNFVASSIVARSRSGVGSEA